MSRASGQRTRVSLTFLLLSSSILWGSFTPSASNASDPVDCDAPPTNPQTFTLDWDVRDGQNGWCAGQRQEDEYSNPAFNLKMATAAPSMYEQGIANQTSQPTRLKLTGSQLVPGPSAGDPFRLAADWQSAGRGRVTPISFISSFTGAKLEGEIWRPPASVAGPYPGVIVVGGGTQQWRQLYYWAAQGLAEGGYEVLTYDPQGQGSSETFPHTDDGSSFCTSRGCPGQFPPSDTNVEFAVRDAIKFFISTATSAYASPTPNNAGTNLYNPEFASLNHTVLDSSGRLPIGLAGHSLGGADAQVVGQADPRISAIVAWDASIFLTNIPPENALANAHAPTLELTPDYSDFPTWNSAPPDAYSKQLGIRQLRQLCLDGKQCLDLMQVNLRAGTHAEWTYFPYLRPASRLGERVSMYYTRAWFDAYLKGALSPAAHTAAIAKLRASVFDDSADVSSIGSGMADASDPSINRPYKIAGMPVHNRISFYFASSY
ncbi:MAG: hypothetical protein LC723_07630, partial [Actinobacteria bacterium]|nr:hypothetical protein [Actinomycetota bacterium]